jgi:endoglucanase
VRFGAAIVFEMRHRIFVILALLGALACAPVARGYYSGNLTPGNPLAGHPWYVDTERGSWWVAMREQPVQAAPLRLAAYNPMGKTYGSWVAHPEVEVRNYILRALRSQPGSIPFLNLARIEGQSCPYPATPAGFSEREVDDWVSRFSQGLGGYRVMVVVETDKLTTIGCLPRWAQARRYRELRYEVHVMHVNNPNAIVYIDAGSEDWGKDAATIASRLRRADVAEAQGFVLGASHHNWTYKEVRFGRQISRLLGGKHFVVNTNENGWGPNPRWYEPYYHGGCVPPGEGLGIVPTVRTPDPHLDAFIWSGVPGFENGDCLGYGAHTPYTFYLAEAVSLVLHANPPLLKPAQLP